MTKKLLVAKLESELVKKLKKKAIDEDITLIKLLERIIRSYLQIGE